MNDERQVAEYVVFPPASVAALWGAAEDVLDHLERLPLADGDFFRIPGDVAARLARAWEACQP